MTLAKRSTTQVARPLKVLVPLIQGELAAGQRAGIEHFRRAGAMLREARDQITYGSWGKWLRANFTLSESTAYHYMKLDERVSEDPTQLLDHGPKPPSIRMTTGRTADYAKWKPLHQATRNLDAELFSQERQVQDDEIRLRRALVGELFDIGYKALATRLHPDRGGSKDAMVRLNAIREQLTEIAKTRRWI
jgi:Protein of unknown function (DUF3102)